MQNGEMSCSGEHTASNQIRPMTTDRYHRMAQDATACLVTVRESKTADLCAGIPLIFREEGLLFQASPE